MKAEYGEAVKRALDDAPNAVRKAFLKQLGFLERDLRHPSLHAEKYDEGVGIWQARVNDDWRFYFRIIGDTYPNHQAHSSSEVTQWFDPPLQQVHLMAGGGGLALPHSLWSFEVFLHAICPMGAATHRLLQTIRVV
jgi:hypothetical protein